MMPDFDHLTVVFQPIVHLVTGDVIGYEALGRIKGREGEGFAPVLQHARIKGQLNETYRRLQCLSIEEGQNRPTGSQLFLNVRLNNLSELCRLNDDWSQVVLEVPESDRRLERWGAELAPMRSLGAAIAIDDWGVGTADPLRLIQLEPQWIKIDVALIKQLGNPDVDRLIALLVRWVRRDTQIIAEGLEQPQQIEHLRQLGVRYGQGYGLAHPSRTWIAHVATPHVSRRIVGLRRMGLALAEANTLTDNTLALVEDSLEILGAHIRPGVVKMAEWIDGTMMSHHLAILNRTEYEATLLDHFQQLTRGRLDEGDMERGIKMARMHQEFGIDLSYYVTAYRRFETFVSEALMRHGHGQVVPSLRNLFNWDQSVVLHAYQELLDRDALTGVLTRRAFFDRVRRDVRQTLSASPKWVMGIIDITGFGRLSQTKGRVYGDHVLSQLGIAFQGLMTSNVAIGRIGGDEFIIWGPYADTRKLRLDVSRVRQKLQSYALPLEVHLGLSVWGRDGQTVEALYARADHRLRQHHPKTEARG